MQSNAPTPVRHVRRKYLYVAAFVLLSALAVYSLLPTVGAWAETTAPAGQTIPPGGTIPPAPDGPDNQGQINIIHVAPVSGTIINTGVQVCDASDNKPVTGYIYYQQQTGYLDLEVGNYDWYVSNPDNACAAVLLDLPSFFIGEGSRLSLVVYGDGTVQPLDSLLIVEQLGYARYRFPIFFAQ